MFIGRKRELSLLRDLWKRKIASLVVVKGRRRIGKSRLIEEFAKESRFVVFSGLAPTDGVTAQSQRDEFARQLGRYFYIPTPPSADWSDLFWHLAHQTQKGPIVILMDEISWMGGKDPTFLPKFKNAWDLHLKKNNELIVVLCGSVSSWIEKNIISHTGFVGRIDLILTVGALSIAECNAFWGAYKNQWSVAEKLKVLGVTGGVPRYLEILVPQSTAEENIRKLCFNHEGFLFNEFDQLFNDLFMRRGPSYKDILLSLVEKPKATLEDICDYLKVDRSGVVNEYVNDLISAGFLKRDYTWSIRSGEISKLNHVRIHDNYVRFYLNYILPNRSRIENQAFKNRTLTTLPGWPTIMGLQFENLVLHNRHLLQAHLHIDPNEIVNDNPYFQRPTRAQKGCQIDYMIQTRFSTLYVCEIKFSMKPVGHDVVDAVREKINALALPKNVSYRPVLIHVNGVEDEVIASEFFANIVNFGDFFNDHTYGAPG